jgi:hypothetical protein
MRTLARSALALSLLALATAAHAGQGVNLRWNACLGDAGTANRNFACNTNTGSETLVASFELGTDLPLISGNEVVIDLASAGTAIPAWWQMWTPGSCRPSSLSMNATISASADACADWANAQAFGGIAAYDIGSRGVNTARIKLALSVAVLSLSGLSAGQEYFSFNLVIIHAKTVGTGACAGCTTPVCIVFSSDKLTTPVPALDRMITGPTNGTDSNFITWQGGAGVVVPPGPWGAGGSGCPSATPTRRTTWGAVRALYR